MPRTFLWAAFFGLALASGVQGQVDEYQVKALFLYNFTKYVSWPSQSFSSPTDPIVICVLGPNPFGDALEKAVSGKVVAGRTLVVRHLAVIPAKCNCQILFVAASEGKRFRSAAAALKASSVLSVGEAEGFTGAGGVINFKLEDGKVRFEINVEAAEQAHVYISSKLLNLAQIVKN
jgi:hypothetical protein